MWVLDLQSNYKIIVGKKSGDGPGPLGDFVKSLVTERIFLFFPFFLKKLNKLSFFYSKRAPICPKTKKFCTGKKRPTCCDFVKQIPDIYSKRTRTCSKKKKFFMKN